MPCRLAGYAGIFLIFSASLALAEQEGSQPSLSPSAPLIVDVRVRGNQHLPPEAIIDRVKSVLAPGVRFTDRVAARARDLLMRAGWFREVTIGTEPAEGGVIVIINVVERPIIQRIMFTGNTVVSNEELLATITTRIGHMYNRNTIAADIERIRGLYERKGYRCRVDSATFDAFGNLTFVIVEYRIEGYEIEGLKRTKLWVVERQIDLRPGVLYSDDLIRQQVARIRQLGLFEEVTVDFKQGKIDPASALIVVFKCKERRTGQVNFSVGYSSLDRFVMGVGVREQNFRGQAERVSLIAEFFGRTSYQFDYLIPYFKRSDTAVELSLFDTERRRQFFGSALVSTSADRFEERRKGGYLRISRPMGDHQRVSIRLRSETVSSAFFQGIRIISGPSPATGGTVAPADLDPTRYWRNVYRQNLAGSDAGPGNSIGPVIVAAPLHPGGRLASLTLGFTRDLRDNPADPRRGYLAGASAEIAGSVLGGEHNFRKFLLEYRHYMPLGRGVLAGRAMAGWSSGDLPLFETFSVGGVNTLRGYTEDRWRGRRLLLFNLEYRHPITDKLTGVAFVDVGDAYGGVYPTPVPGFSIAAEDQDFTAHWSVGAGVRVLTPIGPLRLDIGYGKDGSKAHFSFGHTF